MILFWDGGVVLVLTDSAMGRCHEVLLLAADGGKLVVSLGAHECPSQVMRSLEPIPLRRLVHLSDLWPSSCMTWALDEREHVLNMIRCHAGHPLLLEKLILHFQLLVVWVCPSAFIREGKGRIAKVLGQLAQIQRLCHLISQRWWSYIPKLIYVIHPSGETLVSLLALGLDVQGGALEGLCPLYGLIDIICMSAEHSHLLFIDER